MGIRDIAKVGMAVTTVAFAGWALTKLLPSSTLEEEDEKKNNKGDTAEGEWVVVAVVVVALVGWGLLELVLSSYDCFPNENTYGINGKLISGCRKLKMNTDGSVRGDPARAGFGGVIRDENGSWVMGFYGRIFMEFCKIEQAEIWGLYHGLKIIQDDQKFRDVEIESDSEAAIDQIKSSKTRRKSPMDEIIEECKEMLQRTGCTLKPIPGKKNKVADRLADLGRTQETNLVLLSSPPDKETERLLEADARSASSY